MKRITIFVFIFLVVFAAAPAIHAQASATFRQEGIASWYGAEYDGRPTASGEIFDSTQFTAAHPSLPFGTILTVTNTHNNRQVRVRVNDRGPFVAARIIDLSRAAAEVLDMIVTGTSPVIVESANALTALGPVSVPVPVSAPQPVAAPATAVAPQPVPVTTAAAPTAAPQIRQDPIQVFVAPPEPEARIPQESQIPSISEPARTAAAIPPAGSANYAANIIGGIPQAGTGKLYRLQVGAYRIPRNAVEAFDRLKEVGLDPKYEVNGDIYRVVLARLDPKDIPAIAEKLYYAGFGEAIIREER